MESTISRASKQLAKKYETRILDIRESILALAKDLASDLQKEPALRDELVDLGINVELLNRLERCGCGHLLPDLVLNTSRNFQPLCRLSVSDQKRAIEEGVEVMDADESGVRWIPITDLTAQQLRQAFNGSRVRTPAEQRSWLKEHKVRTPAEPLDTEVRFTKDSVVFRGTKIPRRTLLQWLQEIG